MTEIYGWDSIQTMADSFEITADELADIRVIYASYDGGGYDGDAFVLFEKGGNLFEVHGGHCSCYGLEGQWTPEETTWEALVDRVINGNFGRGSHDSFPKFLRSRIAVAAAKK